MKKMFVAAAALSLLAAPAFAANLGGNNAIAVNGTVASQCAVVGNGSGPITIADLVDGDGKINATQGPVNHFGNIWCNNAGATVSVTATPLTTPQTTTDTGSFQSHIDISVAVSNVDLVAQANGGVVTTAGASNSISAVVPVAFETGQTNYDQFRITPVASTKRPVSGNYAGTVTIAIQGVS